MTNAQKSAIYVDNAYGMINFATSAIILLPRMSGKTWSGE